MITPAEALCWCSYLLTRESIALYYEPIPPTEYFGRSRELEDGADAFSAAAHALDPDPGLYRRAMERWDRGYAEASATVEPAEARS